MAEAGPSGLQSASNGSAPSRSDYGFPEQDGSQHQPQHRSTRPDRTVNMNSLGLGHPPSSRRPSSGGRISSLESNSSRRRVRSMPGDDDVLPPGPSRLRQIHDMEIEPHKRVASLTRRGTGKQRATITPLSNMDGHADYSSTPLSDEYDLSHEDPRILEDVQRAIHLKARREARLRALQSIKQPAEPPVTSDQGSLSSFSSHPSPARARLPEPLPPVQPSTQVRSSSVESEVDFSPSIGAAPIHPVPSSSDNGATLDWTASSSDDERDRRWPLLAKKRTKERGSASKAVVENQESLYSEKLAQIKARVKPHTLRKAAITGEQLQRRYSVLLDSTRPATTFFRRPLPLTWLKHLLDKRATPGSARLPWHLSALIIEEYAKALYPPLQPIPEDREIPDGTTPATSSQGNSTSSPPKLRLKFLALEALGLGLCLSHWNHLCPGRDKNSGGDSRRSSYDFMHGRKQSLAYTVDSPGSSLRNASLGATACPRPAVVHRCGTLPVGCGVNLTTGVKRLIIRSELHLGAESWRGSCVPRFGRDARSKDGISDADGVQTARDPAGSMHFGNARLRARNLRRFYQRLRHLLLSRGRLSGCAGEAVPSFVGPLLVREQEKQQLQASESKSAVSTNITPVLEETMDQNKRTRQLLQRVGAQIREYENVQSRLSDLLGKSYTAVPVEVLDALSHDPASVIGPTRRYKSWRAVEDIHERIRLQRKTLRDFASALTSTENDDSGGENSAFREILTTLADSLQQLHGHRMRLAGDAEEVAEALVEVKESHTAVKREYNEVMAHTSHKLWLGRELSEQVPTDLGHRLGRLTLLLDTVTPVWRNYGKVIGDDVQDFLIIPWYRNEFTGEKQRYPIKHLPRRSFRHWIGLFLFFFISAGVLVLQTSAALSSTANYNLPWITNPGFRWLVIPFFTVGLFIQWISVIVEFCILLAQIGVILWWIGWAVRLCH
ncbi:hypothetical protein BC629DRAFT_1739397 [Irpex lacteus]|nr:hypothetical protein BC629DRAFT_1739397 [Irpex lacteus]